MTDKQAVMAHKLRHWWQEWMITADEARTRARRVLRSSSSPMSPSPSLNLSGLEPRILFSAAPIDPASLPGGEEAAMVIEVETPSTESDAATIETLAAETPRDQSVRELILIDAAVPGMEQMLDDLSASGLEAEVFVLDAERDGIDQITEILEGRSDFQSIHIVSHAEDGAVKLGNVWLGESNLAGYTGQIASWQTALASDADILFYGCDLAGSSSGQTLLGSISTLTGADVAASTDDTGHADFGGDWNLEYRTGVIESQVAFSDGLQQSWHGKLATITVTTFADVIDGGDGVTSLREAIIQANTGGGGDTIVLGAGTYTLSIAGEEDNAAAGDLDILNDMTITGAGAQSTVIDGGGMERVFHISTLSGHLTMSDVTVQGGDAGANGDGGGFYLEDSTSQLTLDRVNVSANTARLGGGIYNLGTMTLTDVLISSNTAYIRGGGIWNQGLAELDRVTIYNNQSDVGGGIYNDGFSGEALSLTNVTVTSNTASSSGGGLYSFHTADIVNSTFTLNSAGSGGGIRVQGGTTTITNTIVDGNSVTNANADVQGTFNSQGYNLIGDLGNSSGFGGTDITGASAMLDVLADNGGFAPTHALLAGSPAINAGTATGAPVEDQRGYTRDGSPDIGAYEAAMILDQFNAVSYSGSDGALPWAGDWQEFGDGTGPTGGSIMVTTHLGEQSLQIRGAGDGAVRQADLSGYAFATLSLDYARSGMDVEDAIVLEISTDGTLWTEIDRFQGPATDAAFVGTSYDISAFIDIDTQIRFTAVNMNQGGDYFYVDNVQIFLSNAVGNSPPTVATTPGFLNYTENDPATVIDPGVTVSDANDTHLDSATVSIVSGFTSGQDVLHFTNQNGITGNYDAATGILTLSGSATVAHYEAALQSIAYENTSGNPSTATRIVQFQVNDGQATASASRSISVTAVGGPVLAANPDTAVTAEETPVVIDVLGNDAGTSTVVLDNTQPSNGTAVNNGDGTITYTPNTDFNGADTFDYSIIDGRTTSYWQLEGDAADSVGSRNGTVNGATTVAGFDGNGLSFDGVDDHVVISDFGYTGDFTLSFRFQVDDISGSAFQYLYSHGTPETNNDLNVYIGETGSAFGGILKTSLHDFNDPIDPNMLDVDINGLIGDGQWHSYTLTIEVGVGARVYIDGNLDRSSSHGADAMNPPTDVYLGARSDLDGQRFFGGAMDSVHLIGALLDDTEVAQLHFGNTRSASVDVTVTPVNDDPVADAGGPYVINEGDSLNLVGSASDDIDGDTLSFAWDLDNDGIFGEAGEPTTESPVVTWATLQSFGITNDGSFTIGLRVDDGNGGVHTTTTGVTVSNVDPTITSSATTTIDENTTAVMTVTGTDPADTVSFSLIAGDDQTKFSIDSVTGALSFIAAPDYEGFDDLDGDNVYQVEVMIGDGDGGFSSQLISVTVLDDNDVAIAVDDNHSGANEGATYFRGAPGVLINDTDQDGDTLTAVLVTGPSFATSFTLNADGSYNYQHDDSETTTDTFTYQVWDGTALSNVATVTIDINPVNDVPVVDAGQTFDVSELAPMGTSLGLVTATDDDTGTIFTNWAITSGNADGIFFLDSGTGELQVVNTTNLNHEVTDTYVLDITVSDGVTTSVSQSITINVIDENEVATDITLDSTNVSENAAGAVVGNLGVVDPDAGDTHSWSVDDTRFEIVGGQLKLKAGQSLDTELEPTVNLTITATDQGGASFGKAFIITVDNVNEVPTDIILDSTNVFENAAGAVVGNLGVVDPDAGDTHSWTVDDTRFEIVGGQLRLKAGQSLDKELEPTVNLTVTATDQGGASFGKAFLITVDNVNEAPTDITLDSTNVSENAAGAVVGNLGVIDPDAGDTHSWSVDDTRFEIVGGQLKLKAGQSLDKDLEPTVNLTITATDQGAASFGKAFVITVDNVNEAPTDITLDSTNVSENAAGAVVGNLGVVDPDAGDTHSWTVDDTRFEIVGGQLRLKAGQSLDKELEPTVNLTVTATDQGGASFGKAFIITVDNVNEAPTDITLDSTNVSENAPGAVVGNLGAVDPDAGDTHSWTVSDTRFEIVGGQLKLKAGQSLDNELEPTVNLTITTTDQGGASFGKAFIITVDNVNEAPTDITLDSTNVSENVAGAVVGNLGVVDPDAGDTHSWTVSDARFEIVGGQLKLKAGQSLDTELEPTVNLTVTATDQGGASFGRAFVITVDNVNEAPTDITLGSTNVSENAAGAVVGNLGVADPDAGDTHSWSVSDTRFEIVGGQLKLKAGQSLDTELEPTINLTVTATDQGGASFGKGFLITVNNVNEAPIADAETYNVAAGNTLTSSTPGVLSGDFDPDGGPISAVLLAGPANGTLTFNADGSFVYTPDASFSGTDSFVYEAWDGSISSASAVVTIQVSPVVMVAPLPPTLEAEPEPEPEPEPESEPDNQSETEDEAPILEFLPATDNPPRRPSQGVTPRGTPTMPERPESMERSELDSPLIVYAIPQDAMRVNSTQTADWISRTAIETAGLANRFILNPLAEVSSQVDYALMARPGAMWNDLDQQLQYVDSQIHGDLIVVGAAGAAASSFTVGVVAWALRTGFLASGLLAQMPAWRAVDPLLIMQGFAGTENGETLEDLMKRQRQSLDE